MSRKIGIILTLLLLTMLTFQGITVFGETNNYTASHDAYVRDGTYADTNYGSATGLAIKDSSEGANRQAYMKIDLTGVSFSSVDTATLYLYSAYNVPDGGNATVTVSGLTDDNWVKTV